MRLREVVTEKLNLKFDAKTDEMIHRMNEEIALIENYGYEEYFLKVYAIIKKSKELGYPTSFMGNMGDLFVAYLLGLSHINPLDLDINFDLALREGKHPYVNIRIAYAIYFEIVEFAESIDFTDRIVSAEELDLIADIPTVDLNNKNIVIDTYYKNHDFDIEYKEVSSFSELLKYKELSLGTDTWVNNADNLYNGKTEYGKVDFMSLISNRNEVYKTLIDSGFDKGDALEFLDLILMNNKTEKYNYYMNLLSKNKDLPLWYVSSLSKVSYLFSRMHVAENLVLRMKVESIKYK